MLHRQTLALHGPAPINPVRTWKQSEYHKFFNLLISIRAARLY